MDEETKLNSANVVPLVGGHIGCVLVFILATDEATAHSSIV